MFLTITFQYHSNVRTCNFEKMSCDFHSSAYLGVYLYLVLVHCSFSPIETFASANRFTFENPMWQRKYSRLMFTAQFSENNRNESKANKQFIRMMLKPIASYRLKNTTNMTLSERIHNESDVSIKSIKTSQF